MHIKKLKSAAHNVLKYVECRQQNASRCADVLHHVYVLWYVDAKVHAVTLFVLLEPQM